MIDTAFIIGALEYAQTQSCRDEFKAQIDGEIAKLRPMQDEQVEEARRFYVREYGLPTRPLGEAIDSDYHTLAEERALAHAGLSVRQ